MKRLRLAVVVLVGVCVVGAVCAAQPPADAPVTVAKAPVAPPDTPAGKMLARVLKMFGGDYSAITDGDLSASFKEAVPLVKLRQVTAQIRMSEGALTLDKIEDGATDRSLVADVLGETKGTALKVRLSLDETGKIVGLLIQPGVDKRVPELKSWDDLKDRLKVAAESSAFTVQEVIRKRVISITDDGPPGGNAAKESSGVPILESRVFFNSDTPLAIGSAFKLWVLAALADAIQSGDAAWDEKLKIQDAIKSLPSGVMQDKPDGKEFTLREFAEKMISISDNTATDHLIHRLGRDRCEKAMRRACLTHGDANQPFLTTRDLFVLKLSGSDDLAKHYMEAGTDTRRTLLPDLAKETPKLALAALWKTPRWIDRLEWFASGEDMARSLLILDDLARGSQSPAGDPRPPQPQVREILSINPGIPIDRKVWTYVGFKGGSEPGVLSLNWLLERKDGRKFLVSLTLNDTRKPIDEALGVGLATRAVEFLGK